MEEPRLDEETEHLYQNTNTSTYGVLAYNKIRENLLYLYIDRVYHYTSIPLHSFWAKDKSKVMFMCVNGAPSVPGYG